MSYKPLKVSVFHFETMKTLLSTIQSRRSLFPADFKGGTIEQKDLDQILEAARWAPIHKKTQPWKYAVVQGDGLKKLGDFMIDQFDKNSDKKSNIKARKLAEKMQQSAAVILIFLSRDPKESIPEWEEIAAVSMSVQNMWLMLHDLGYGGYWSSPKEYASMSEFDALQVEVNDKFLGFFYMGQIDNVQQPLPERKAVKDFTLFVK